MSQNNGNITPLFKSLIFFMRKTSAKGKRVWVKPDSRKVIRLDTDVLTVTPSEGFIDGDGI